MRLIVDIDGVCADFNTGFLKALRRVTGRELAPLDDATGRYLPTTWHWPGTLGVTPEDVCAAWKHIDLIDDWWWEDLRPLPGAVEFLRRLDLWSSETPGAEVVFVTSRGINRFAGAQTRRWLMAHGVLAPTVLMEVEDKAAVAKALMVDVMIDDKPEHLYATRRACGSHPKLYLRAAPYNVDPMGCLEHDVTILHSLDEVTL